MARKKPAKTNARKPNHDDRAPFGFYIPSEVTTSSRTQPPAKPVKATRVRRPRDTDSMRVYLKNILVTGLGLMDSSEARRRAAWLTHAAAYLEQEARRGK